MTLAVPFNSVVAASLLHVHSYMNVREKSDQHKAMKRFSSNGMAEHELNLDVMGTASAITSGVGCTGQALAPISLYHTFSLFFDVRSKKIYYTNKDR